MEIEKAGTDYQKSTVYTSDTISDLKLGDEMLIEENIPTQIQRKSKKLE